MSKNQTFLSTWSQNYETTRLLSRQSPMRDERWDIYIFQEMRTIQCFSPNFFSEGSQVLMFITREIVLRRCVLRRCVYFSFYKFLSANCPAGTYYGGGKCVECPIGYYQDQEKQLSCLKCPTDKGTVKPGAKHCQSEFLTNYTYNTTFTPLLHSHHYTHTTIAN